MLKKCGHAERKFHLISPNLFKNEFFDKLYNSYHDSPRFLLPRSKAVTLHSRCTVAMSSLVQYVVVRGDLAQALKWPLGAVVAQACHACTAVAFMFHDDPNTRAYAADLDRMHKVVLEVRKQAVQ